jgi:hypothetical protein
MRESVLCRNVSERGFRTFFRSVRISKGLALGIAAYLVDSCVGVDRYDSYDWSSDMKVAIVSILDVDVVLSRLFGEYVCGWFLSIDSNDRLLQVTPSGMTGVSSSKTGKPSRCGSSDA